MPAPRCPHIPCRRKPSDRPSVVDQIVESLQAIGKSEVHSSVIGNMVLDHLAHIDQVAYIRFATVYLNMNDVNEVQAEIDRLIGRRT